ncbi:MAG: Asp-tRNA(Asn)/Glu-tRNA(Gln) amidotransferase subunit GatB [Candidatus Dependentiae bacterium]|nr:Asp-tRNA(Asn)/Glu-tRNA(Gln) amidotransferase subunit GatB [Candidatus Dependentiae bacterium]
MTKTASILDTFPEYEVTIGMEVHVQLTTKTKIFCSCANVISKDPNTNICNVCAGYPGSLPVLNKDVITCGILAGLATHSTIATICSFDRKHYFYPDLPKGYQITQQYDPICRAGYVPIRLEDGSIKHIHLTRIHIEEDAGKNIHSSMSNESFVDLNRAGTPLLEIVSEPDISSAYETKAYLKALRAIVQHLAICSGNMEEGAFRADTNISVRKKGATELGTKCELKNINSFKFIGDAVEYEIERQIMLLKNGGTVRQETRLWDSKERCSVIMRTKEEAADYRFFEDPDLPHIHISSQEVESIKQSMPEMPFAKFDRFCSQLGLTPYEAEILVEDKDLASYFDQAMLHTQSKQLINWVLRDIMGYLKENKVLLGECKVTPEKLASIMNMVDAGTINGSAAKKIFELVAHTGHDPKELVKEQGLEQIGSVDELEKIVQEVIAQNPTQVEQYKQTRNERMFGFFVGKAMQKTQGKGNPAVFTELFLKLMQ